MLEVDAVRSGSLERTVTGGRGSQEGVEMGWEGLAGKGGNVWEWLAGNEFGSSATTLRPFWEG